MRILFVSFASNLNTYGELARIMNGHTLELVDGLLDRAGLDRALRSAQYDCVHFAGHGAKGVLGLPDGELDAADLASMLEAQTQLRFIIINACNSLSVGTTIHNSSHVPIIAHDAEIKDVAAVRFVETFYRSFRQTDNVKESFERARSTLMRLMSDQVLIPQLINGDMATRHEMDCITSELREVFSGFDSRLVRIEDSVQRLQRNSPRDQIMVVLLAILVLAQFATPWLNNLFAH